MGRSSDIKNVLVPYAVQTGGVSVPVRLSSVSVNVKYSAVGVFLTPVRPT